MIKNALVLGSTKGIGKAFLEALILNGYQASPLGRNQIDTTSEESVDSFLTNTVNNSYDFLVLNAGGLKPISEQASVDEMISSIEEAKISFFESQIKLLLKLNLNPKSTVVFISSHVVHNIEPRLISSAVARAATEKFLEYLSHFERYKDSTFISLRFGPILTDRLNNLLISNKSSQEELAKSIFQERISNTEDVKSLANLIITSRSLFGSGTYSFDSGISQIKSGLSL